MIQDNNITKLIKELLCGMDSIYDIKETQYNEDDTSVQSMDNVEKEISYINELDFSQEKVLKEINSSDSIVVQGPPGTGKSQTITSIISQCILQNKSVLMVSEKKTALDVIYSRLGSLSKFALLIDDVENKQVFYEQLNSIINTMNSSQSLLCEAIKNQIVESIKQNIQLINYNIRCLETIEEKIYGINDFDTSMYNVYNICKRIDLNNQKEMNDYIVINEKITKILLNLKFLELTKIKSSLFLSYPVI